MGLRSTGRWPTARQLQVRLPAMLKANQEAGYLVMKVVERVAHAQKT